jgi:hypothetical protein
MPVPAPKPRPKDTVRIHGTVRGKSDNLPAPGATIVAAALGLDGEEVTISDEHGEYTLDVKRGTYNITVYYADSTTLAAHDLVITGDIELVGMIINDTATNWGCVFWSTPPPELTTQPRFGLAVRRPFVPVSRDRTHRAWIAPVVGADVRTAVATVEDGSRLQSAPGIPIAFLEEVTTHTLRIPIGVAAGSGGGAEVALRTGSNETHGTTQLIFGLDRDSPRAASGGVEVFASGPLKQDTAWIGTGLVANRDPQGVLGAAGMVTFNYAQSAEHQLAVAALGQTQGDTVHDGWTNARWTSKFDDNKLEIRGIATAEQLELGSPAEQLARVVGSPAETTNRIGGQLDLKWRHKAMGYHVVTVAAAGGTGYRGELQHDDVTLAAGDSWQVHPNIDLDYGVRYQTRVFDGDRAVVVAPRISLGYDWTKEGRSDAFVAYQRVPHLDDGMPGDWHQLDSRFHDEVATGVSYERDVENPIMTGAAMRVRWSERGDAEVGAEAWARVERRRVTIHAAATTLGRVGSVVAQSTLVNGDTNKLLAGATLRATPDASAAGTAVTWRHVGNKSSEKHDLTFDTTLEGYAGERGPGARLLLGGTW